MFDILDLSAFLIGATAARGLIIKDIPTAMLATGAFIFLIIATIS